MLTSKKVNYLASQRAPLNFNVIYVTVMKYTCTYKINYKTGIFLRASIECLDLLLVKHVYYVEFMTYLFLSMVKACLLCNDIGIKL